MQKEDDTDMNEQTFWKIIETLHPSIYTLEERIERIEADLSALEMEDVLKFDRVLWWLMAKASTDEIWAASCILTQNYSIEGFRHFRLWLVMQGQRIFKKALNDGETLDAFIDAFKLKKVNVADYEVITELVRENYVIRTQKHDYEEANTFLKSLNYQEVERVAVPQTFEDALPELCQKMGWDVKIYKGEWASDKPISE